MAAAKKIEESVDKVGIPSETRKRVRNWIEKILTSTPQPLPMPEVAAQNEELFVKECQTRFEIRKAERAKYEQAKINLKIRAVAALPAALKEDAIKVDHSLWPMGIMLPTTTPPTKEWLYDQYRIIENRNRFY